MLKRACAIIILHNHPSGDVSPSKNDIEVTDKLKKVCEMLGVEVLDHIIFSSGNKFYSLSEKN
ncbi:hypothetical protein ISS03_00510 [Patescibacteria group bacterium]|nr:hypothetical protein [Patescibacteria group bacterium]